jgi:hypothetical protein
LGLKSKRIPQNTTFSSLFKVISSQAQSLHESGKTNFTADDRVLFYVHKALVELKSEEIPDGSDLHAIINLLTNKLKDLKMVE